MHQNQSNITMKDTIIVYGSTSGNCESVANRIAEALGVASSSVISASNLSSELVDKAENLILGSSTWGSGDLQDEWYDGVEVIKSANLTGKTVAVFGCGDSCGFGTTFCEAMKTLYDAAESAGATMIGSVPTDGHTFDDSAAVVDGKFVGLAIDEDNESDMTDGRIAAWIRTIKPEL